MSRRLARSPIGTGPSPERPSSASARSAYGLFVVIEITASMLVAAPAREGPPAPAAAAGAGERPPAAPTAPGGRRGGGNGLQPAALGGDEDGLRAVDRAELAVDV